MPTTRVGDVAIAYSTRGSGPPVLCIVGIGLRAADWNERGLLAPLSDRWTLVTFDNRGTGASDRPEGEYSLDVMADEAVGVLDALGLRRAHVVGYSMGGMIAQLVALRHPERVDRLVLLATHGGGPDVVPPAPETFAAAFLPDPTLSPAERMRRSYEALVGPGVTTRHPEVIDAMVAIAVEQPTPEVTFARQMQAIQASDRHHDLPRIAAPTLVVHGTEDPLIPPANGAALARAIPGARLVELEGCGHMPAWECPALLSGVIRDFLAATG